MGPVPIRVFGPSYKRASTAGKLVAVDQALGALSRKAAGSWPGQTMDAWDWAMVDVLLDERNELLLDDWDEQR